MDMKRRDDPLAEAIASNGGLPKLLAVELSVGWNHKHHETGVHFADQRLGPA